MVKVLDSINLGKNIHIKSINLDMQLENIFYIFFFKSSLNSYF